MHHNGTIVGHCPERTRTVRSRNSPIILSSLAEARPSAGIREALRTLLGTIAGPGIGRHYRRVFCGTKDGIALEHCMPTRRNLEKPTKWANEVCGFATPYYPACAHLRRRIDSEQLPQVRTASDRSCGKKPCLATQQPSADGRVKLLVT
jgi:hypothetical protein